MSTPVMVDRSLEETPAARGALRPAAGAWLGCDVDPTCCIVRLGPEALDELADVARDVEANPLPIVLRRPQDHELRAVATAMGRARALLEAGPGVAVVDRLDIDALGADRARAVFFVVGQLVGRPVAQKWDGSMLYDVRDTGRSYGYGVRGSRTRVELVFHTDNAFAVAPPERVGLMCLHPARAGGSSRFCSLAAVHNRLLERHPRLLERLYRSMLWDRQAEHAPPAPRVLFAPMFRREGDRLLSRANVSLVRKGYDVAGARMDAPLAEALEAVETVSGDPELWFELPIERGQLQYLNNVDTAHYRSAFVDFDEPRRKRHLVRTWHRDWGRPCYDG